MPAPLEFPEILSVHPLDPSGDLLQCFASLFATTAYLDAKRPGDRISERTAGHWVDGRRTRTNQCLNNERSWKLDMFPLVATGRTPIQFPSDLLATNGGRHRLVLTATQDGVGRR